MQEKLAQVDEVREDVILQEVEVILLDQTKKKVCCTKHREQHWKLGLSKVAYSLITEGARSRSQLCARSRVLSPTCK